MELKILCSTWVREADEKVIKIIQESDKMPSVAELVEKTKLPPHAVEHTLKMLKQQQELWEARQKIFRD